jgi:hypothetical protein
MGGEDQCRARIVRLRALWSRTERSVRFSPAPPYPAQAFAASAVRTTVTSICTEISGCVSKRPSTSAVDKLWVITEADRSSTFAARRILRRKEIPKILVAEDDPNLARYYEMLLSQWNCETVVEHTGTDAIRRAATFRPDVALLGVVMPEMGGVEAGMKRPPRLYIPFEGYSIMPFPACPKPQRNRGLPERHWRFK